MRVGDAKLEGLIQFVRGHRVILDADLARLFGVSTKRLNESMKRNRTRFPVDFAFRLSSDEFESLKRELDTRSQAAKGGGGSNWSQFATSSSRHRGAAYRPWAFTEHGALMAANVLRSEKAVHMSVFVVRAFVRMREVLISNAAVLRRLAEIDKTLLHHDVALRDVYRKLLPLLTPPESGTRRRIGF